MYLNASGRMCAPEGSASASGRMCAPEGSVSAIYLERSTTSRESCSPCVYESTHRMCRLHYFFLSLFIALPEIIEQLQLAARAL